MYDLTHRWLTNLKSHQKKNTLAYLSGAADLNKNVFGIETCLPIVLQPPLISSSPSGDP
jgi:hypothetical protein